MKLPLSILFFAASVSIPSLAHANASADASNGFGGSARNKSGKELPPYLQCVPYARQTSGIEIYGNARTWWQQAAGRYERGQQPRVGAVMSFKPHRNMVEGHVATVAKVIDKRTVLLDHANWSPINGRRGQIERGVKAVDVSRNNDWSEVQVWYAPLGALGKTRWPLNGFIYSDKAGSERNNGRPQLRTVSQIAGKTPSPSPVRARGGPKPSAKFSGAFAGGLPSGPSRRESASARGAPNYSQKAKAGFSASPPRRASQASWAGVSPQRLAEINRQRPSAVQGSYTANRRDASTQAFQSEAKRGFVSKAGSVAGDVAETAFKVGKTVGKGAIFVGKGAVSAVGAVVEMVD